MRAINHLLSIKPINKKFINYKAFTLMEVMAVIIIIAVVAGFALPNYTRNKNRAYERDMEQQLYILQEANRLYFANNGQYAALNNVADANNILNINLILSSGAIFTYSRNQPSCYLATLSRVESGVELSVSIDEEAATACCSSVTCPTLTACNLSGCI